MNNQNNENLISEWLKSIDDFIIQDIRKCIENDFLGTGLIILTLTGVECISGYYCGKRADNKTFCKFLSSKHFPQAYATFSDQIYQNLRNGLVHDHTNKNNIFKMYRNENDSSHLEKKLNNNGDIKITFNREIFAKDLLKAWETYSKQVFDDPTKAQNVRKRINDKNRSFLIVESENSNNQEIGVHVKYSGGTIGYWENEESHENSTN